MIIMTLEFACSEEDVEMWSEYVSKTASDYGIEIIGHEEREAIDSEIEEVIERQAH